MSVSPDWFRSLAECGNVGSLRSAIEGLGAEFGMVKYVDIVTVAAAEKRRAVCFLRLESAAQETQLMESLGLSRFGQDVLLVVDLALDAGPPS
jgi:hypothetical protein